MPKQVAVILGHPDPRGGHFGNALAEAYAQGAAEEGHQVKLIDIARLEFPLLRTKEEFEGGLPPESIRQAQSAIEWAQHLVFIFPLWLGTMPALVKGFLEQVFRPGFAVGSGIGPIKESLIGGIESPDGTRRAKWLARVRELGRKGV